MEKTTEKVNQVVSGLSEKVKSQLRNQIGAVETFLDEVVKTDKLDDQHLDDRFEIFVGDQAREIRVVDKDINLTVFSIENTFVQDKKIEVVSHVSYGSFDADRFPATAKALEGLDWVYSK